MDLNACLAWGLPGFDLQHSRISWTLQGVILEHCWLWPNINPPKFVYNEPSYMYHSSAVIIYGHPYFWFPHSPILTCCFRNRSQLYTKWDCIFEFFSLQNEIFLELIVGVILLLFNFANCCYTLFTVSSWSGFFLLFFILEHSTWI